MAKAPSAPKAAKKVKQPRALALQSKLASAKKKPAKAGGASRVVHAELLDAEPQNLRTRTVGSLPGAAEKIRTKFVSGDLSRKVSRNKSDGSPNTKATNHPDEFDPTHYESTLDHGPTDAELEELDQTLDVDPDLGELMLPTKTAQLLAGNVEEHQNAIQSVSSTDPVTTYLAEIRKYGLLTREQEHELAVRYREHGDSKAAEMLVTSNLRFVVKVAAEYSRFGAKLIDLIQEGNVGLMHAVREYNPYKGVKLITYAVWWIRGYIQEYLMRQYSMVRIGTTQNQRKLFYRLQKEKNLLESMGRESSYALLSSRLGVSEDEVATMTKRLTGRDVSLSQPLDNGESAATLLDFEESLEPDAERQIGDQEELTVLKDNLSILRPKLSEKETYLLDERILADDPLTLQEIGEHFGVTREAVRQLEVRLIGKIRAAVTESLNGPRNFSIEDDDD